MKWNEERKTDLRSWTPRLIVIEEGPQRAEIEYD
ncbi:uncharacterized protein G2W53_008707 [Senna tora]|uniref:Uncharacterized protein n=1 Tax=Senna tora TaxID=362788 RepID=A0A835CHG6_9FABA|nr:uncharacterized protein G2W53_008707 [Senna tora]